MHVLVALAIAAVVASHQLTPFMLILVCFALWLVGRTPHWQLWVGTAALVGLWLVVPAWPFVSGHVTDIVGGLGSGGAGANLGNRVAAGSADHKLVVTARLVQSAVVWLLAGLGILVLVRQRRRVRTVVVLALAPFLLLPLQAYGGEMLIRVFLFGLPVCAFLVAIFLFSVSGGPAWRGVALGAVLVVLAAATVLTRYGNERGEHFSADEVATYSWVAQHTRPGTTIVTFDQNTPWRWQRYSTDTWLSVEDAEPGPRWPEAVTPRTGAARDRGQRGHRSGVRRLHARAAGDGRALRQHQPRGARPHRVRARQRPAVRGRAPQHRRGGVACPLTPPVASRRQRSIAPMSVARMPSPLPSRGSTLCSMSTHAGVVGVRAVHGRALLAERQVAVGGVDEHRVAGEVARLQLELALATAVHVVAAGVRAVGVARP